MNAMFTTKQPAGNLMATFLFPRENLIGKIYMMTQNTLTKSLRATLNCKIFSGKYKNAEYLCSAEMI